MKKGLKKRVALTFCALLALTVTFFTHIPASSAKDINPQEPLYSTDAVLDVPAEGDTEALEKWHKELSEKQNESHLDEADTPPQSEEYEMTLDYATSVNRLATKRFQKYMKDHIEDNLSTEEANAIYDEIFRKAQIEVGGLGGFSGCGYSERPTTPENIPAITDDMTDEEVANNLFGQRLNFYLIIKQEADLRLKAAGLENDLEVVLKSNREYLEPLYEYIFNGEVCIISKDGRTMTFSIPIDLPYFKEDIQKVQEIFPEIKIIVPTP